MNVGGKPASGANSGEHNGPSADAPCRYRSAASLAESNENSASVAAFPTYEGAETLRSSHADNSTNPDNGTASAAANTARAAARPPPAEFGAAALKGQPLVSRAREAAQELFRDFGIPVLLSALIGDEIVAILVLHDSRGRGPGIEVGERRPLLPPVGAPFIAWGSEQAVEAWLAKALPGQRKARLAKWRAALALIRQRGFQVTARSPEGSAVGAQIAQMASGQQVSGFQDRMKDLLGSLGDHLSQLETIHPDETYDVQLIAAPIFDRDGGCVFNLCFGGFPDRLSGALIQTYADRLVRACLQVIRADRAGPV
jgi:DNA-binding IclR family transcriptional regulator